MLVLNQYVLVGRTDLIGFRSARRTVRIYDMKVVGPYATEYEYHYDPSACFGEARDTGVIPEGSDYDFDSEWQLAYGRLSCKGTNCEDMSIHLYYEWRFVY